MKQFFTTRVVKPWKRLPRGVINAPNLSVFKGHLVSALNSMLGLLVSPEMVRQSNYVFAVGPFQLKWSIQYMVCLYRTS